MSVAHESFLVFRGFRYLKAAGLLALASLAAYVLWQPVRGHSGGTWLGYTLGTIGALLIVWLMLFGIRKRRYGPGGWSLKAWLSAHVYLGLSLVVVATLHAGLEFGVNVHTLAYALVLVVVASGAVGLVMYVRVPSLITTNRQSQTLVAMARAIGELDRQCAELALGLGDAFGAEVERSRTGTRVGGSAWRQLRGRDPRCATAQALARTQRLVADVPPEGRPAAEGLVLALVKKQELLQRARRDIRLRALVELWLLVHVPASFALLAALTAHIVSVFFYWG